MKLPVTLAALAVACGVAQAQLRSVLGVELPAPWPPGQASDTHWGTTVPDPYRTLESTRDEAVQRWLRAQAETTDQVLARLPGRQALLERIRALDADARGSVSSLKRTDSGRVFFLRRNPGEQQPKLVLRERIDADPAADRVLIDPDELSRAAGRPVSIMDFAPSPDGSRLAYSTQVSGGEIGELRVIDIGSGGLLAGPIDRIRFASTTWLPDSRSFFYTRLREGFDKLPPTERFGDALRVYRTLDGTEHVIFSASRHPQLGLPPIASAYTFALRDRPLVLAWVGLGVDRRGVMLAARLEDVRAGRPDWKRVVAEGDDVRQAVVAADGALILHSAKDAPRFKLLRWELDDDPSRLDIAQARLLMPESEAVITDVDAARDALYVVRRQGVVASLWRWPPGAREAQPVALPVEGTVGVRHADPRQDGVILTLGSWTRATSDHLLSPDAQGSPRLTALSLARPGVFDAPPGLVSREVMVRSHDGVMVPASIVHREGLRLDGRNPTLLHGYGAYGNFEAPAFGPRLLAWLERGGVYVVAHVRGGGVFGDAWHRGGQKTTKFNTWRDGIAVAEWLIREGYTSPARLAVQGGSAGGIFVGRAATERPDLFAAAISSVGVLDMVRSEQRANGVANVPEYGTVAREDEFRALLHNSSYHALAEGTRYPAFLLVHGVNDIRVDVWQSAKFAARAQALKSQVRPVLMLLDFEAGHGSGTSRAQTQQRLADTWSFLLWQLGVTEFQPAP